MTIDECVRVSRELGQLLEAEEVLSQAYDLEVSSPGIERALRTPRHFAMALGEKVSLVAVGDEGAEARTMRGVLEAIEEGVLTLRLIPERKRKKGQKEPLG